MPNLSLSWFTQNDRQIMYLSSLACLVRLRQVQLTQHAINRYLSINRTRSIRMEMLNSRSELFSNHFVP
jgi:hypothetical protein